jgi:hypothetical protein
MARRPLPAALAFTALVADLAGAHGLALGALLVAIPAAFVLALDCFADALEARCGARRPLVASAGLVLLVLSATLRSPAVVGGVPQVAVSAIVLCLLLYAGLAVSVLVVTVRRQQSRVSIRAESVEPDRLAA